MPVYDIESVQFCARSIACQVSISGHFKEYFSKNCRILNVRNDYSRVGWVRDPSLPPPLPLCALFRSDSDGHFNPYRWPALYKDIRSTEYDVFRLIDDYVPDRKEAMEEKLTELNIGISRISEQMEELTRCYKEFVVNFVLQQKVLREEIQVLRRDAQSFRSDLQDQS
ncbi:hypothetical protein ACET3Z_000870 [Daucus carota]